MPATATAAPTATSASRLHLANLRVSAAELAHLKRMAFSRSVTVSDLMREALRGIGALPAQKA